MHGSWADYLVLAHLGAVLLTYALWLWRRPPLPARVAHARGLLRIAGSWAYWVTRPMLEVLHALHISPTGLTLLGVLLGATSALACATQQWSLAGLALLWSGICDLLDGELARSGHRASPAGAFLDSVCDRICEVAVFLGLLYAMPNPAMELVTGVGLGASLLVSYTRARGEGLGMNCPGGGMERPGRLVVLTLGMFGTAFFHDRALEWVEAAVTAVAVGATGTALMRTLALHQLLTRAHAQQTPAAAVVHPTEDRKAHASLHRNVVRPQP